MKKCDICIIGAGPAGYAAAMRALDLNQKVILIERDRIGGAGLYNGALSSKTFWELSKDVSSVKKRLVQYGKETKFDVSFSQILNEVKEGITTRKNQLESHLLLLQKKKADSFSLIYGQAMIDSPNTVVVKGKMGNEIIEAKNIILATGSTPRKLANIPVDEKIIVTSDGIEAFTDFPKSMVILGAGVIGCEWATIFSNFGTTKVSIIDKADRILPFEDDDISEKVEQNMRASGITIHKNSSLVRMEVVDGEVEYELSYADGHNEVFRVEKALVSIGRIPNTNGLGLEKLGIKFTATGAIEDQDGQTNVPSIYAIGDLTADIALVNVAEMEGRHAVEKIAGLKYKKTDYNEVSAIMFLNPEMAGVGMNEQTAQKKGISYKVATIQYDMIPRAIAMRNNNGFFKILVTNDSEMKILGMRAVGVHASSAIQAVALLISMNKGIDELSELIHPHPSIIEGIQECVRMLQGKSILKPEIFRGMLTCKVCDEKGCTMDVFSI